MGKENLVKRNKIISIQAGKELKVVETICKTIRLEDLHHWCNCEIVECVSYKGYDIWLDEEGKLQNEWWKKANIVIQKRGELNVPDVLVGDLLVCTSNEDGESIPLTDKEVEDFKALLIKGITGYAYLKGYERAKYTLEM